MNDKTAPIYGEATAAGTFTLRNNLMSRGGINVFVRLLPANVPRCGDGFRTYPEECDDGNTADGDGCSSECKVEIGYQCTGGSYKSSASDTCSVFSQCGDGIVSGTEECDDGNVINGDGCSNTCAYEKNIPTPRYYRDSLTKTLWDPATSTSYSLSVGTATNPALALYWVWFEVFEGESKNPR